MRTLSTLTLTTLLSMSVWAQESKDYSAPLSETLSTSTAESPTKLNENYLKSQGMTQTLSVLRQEHANMFGSAHNEDSIEDYLSPTIQNYIALKKGAPLPYALEAMDNAYPDLQKAIYALNSSTKSSYYLKVGVFLPLTSSLKEVSQNMISAIQMALFEHKNNGLLIYIYDIGNSDNQAFKAANLAKQDGIQVAVGPIRAEQTNFMKNALRGIPMVSFTNTEHILKEDLYSINYLPFDQLSTLADHALASGKEQTSALIAENSDTQMNLAQTFTNMLQSATYNQAQIHPTGYYNPETNNNKSEIQRFINYNNMLKTQKSLVKSLSTTEVELSEEDNLLLHELENDNLTALLPFKSLFLPATPKEAKILSHQLAFYDIDANKTQILGLYALTNLVGHKGFPDSLSGTLVPAPSPELTSAFEKRYKEQTGKTAKNLDILAYDAINILNEVSLITKGRFDERVFERPSGFWGYGGAIRFLDNGKNIRNYGIVKLRSNKLVSVVEAKGLATGKIYTPQHTPSRNPFFGGGFWSDDRPKETGKQPKKDDFYIEWF